MANLSKGMKSLDWILVGLCAVSVVAAIGTFIWHVYSWVPAAVILVAVAIRLVRGSAARDGSGARHPQENDPNRR